MKILTVGDIHGSDIWKKINFKDYDLVIFIGDYFDSFIYFPKEEIKNFLELVYTARQTNNIIFLIGNHDIQYFLYYSKLKDKIKCSGFKEEKVNPIIEIYNENKHLFKSSFQIDNFIWSHAGISKGYFNKLIELNKINDTFSIAENLNLLYDNEDEIISCVSKKRGGLDLFGSHFWSDISETYFDSLEGYNQIVGHSKVKFITTRNINQNTTITYVDCLHNENEFLLLDNFNQKIIKL